MRTCGSCTVCCTVMMVPELNKPDRITCSHVCAQGCGIYARRPQSCQDFRCLWLADLVDGEDMRPDLSGIMFTASLSQGDYVRNVWELEEGAFQRHWEMLTHSAKDDVLILRPFDRSPFRLLGKPSQIRAFEKKHITFALDIPSSI